MLASEENLLGLMAMNRELVGQGKRSTTPSGSSGPGLHRESGPWPTGRQCLQRTLRVGLLPPVAFVQRSGLPSCQVRRSRQRAISPRTGMSSCAGDRAPTGCGQAGRLRGERPLRSRKYYEDSPFGASRSTVRHSCSGQQELGARRSKTSVSPAGKAFPQALGALKTLSRRRVGRRRGGSSLSRRASPGRAFPARRIHRDEHELAEPLGAERFYNKRGRRNSAIKEGKQATFTGRDCRAIDFRANEVAVATERAWPTTWAIFGGINRAGASAANQELVADELATQVDEESPAGGWSSTRGITGSYWRRDI